MKERGFTLIELLAVIVILAIIALIATPIILNIIENAREEANKRSIELYESAVKNAIASYQLKTGLEPTTFEDIESYITYDGSEVICEIKELYSDGSIYLASCTVNNQEVEYAYGKLQDSACALTDNDGDGEASLSDMITCGTESFHVMSNDGTNITMLAQYNLDVGNYYTTSEQSSLTPIPNPTGIQNSKAKGAVADSELNVDWANTYGTVAFSTTNYWSSTASSYPAWVYDTNSLLYPYVSAYETYLKETLKVSSASATLMSYEQATTLGCDINKYTCGPDFGEGALENPAPEWVYSTTYWLGSSGDDDDVFYVISNGGFFYGGVFGNDGSLGVRPVITISTSEI